MIQWRIFHIYVGLLEGNPPWPRRKGRWPQSGPWKFPQRIHHSTWGPWLCFVVWLQQRITQAFHKTNPGFYEMVNLEGVQAWAINGYNPGHSSVTWDLSPVTMARYLVVPSIKNLHNTQAVWTIPILEVSARRWIQLNVNLVHSDIGWKAVLVSYVKMQWPKVDDYMPTVYHTTLYNTRSQHIDIDG